MDKPLLVLGTMSGTSCDGLDLALCTVMARGSDVRLEAVRAIPYPPEWAARLGRLGGMDGEEVRRTEREWTAWVVSMLLGAIRDWEPGFGRPDLIGFSGHTWYHEPEGRGTAAIGDASILAAELSLPVVADYRSADVAAGGQGAPLVPMFDACVFPDHAACINFGGIVNLTVMDRQSGPVRAWDVAGCNLLLNAQARRLGWAFDAGGAAARGGQVVGSALSRLMEWPYLGKPAPKSLAAEDLAPLHAILDGMGRPEDALATGAEWIATVVASALEEAGVAGRILCTGGGAHNVDLLDRLGAHLPPGGTVHVPEPEWIEGKEAAAFAWLAWRTAHGMTTSLASVTGAGYDVKGGRLFGTFAPAGSATTPPDDK